MTENVDISLNLDTSGFVQGGAAALSTSEDLAKALRGVTTSSSLTQRALDAVTPKRAGIAALVAFSAAAADTQRNLSDLSAKAAITGQRMAPLTAGIRQLAREFPIGNRGAEDLARGLQSAGLGADLTGKRLKDLGGVMTRLSGSTGESVGGLTTGMIQLTRAFGNTKIDASRLEATSDTLAKISAESGASATGILGFAKSIAPMTRQAGIGASATLGISSAFSKMGEDGFGAATAMNKMLSDLNKSVRDGSSEMNTYASIVGKTRGEFEALFKANPTQALQEITQAIAKPGNTGIRDLERVGLDGSRTQRVLQGLSQQGGIAPEVDSAVRAYGGGASRKGAEASFGGFTDSAAKASAATEQLAVALGRPLLGPLSAFTDILGTITGKGADAVNAVTDTRLGKIATVALGALAVGGAVLFSKVVAAATARTLLTSQVAQAAGAGLRGLPIPVTNPDNASGRAARSVFGTTSAARASFVAAQTERLDRRDERIRQAGGIPPSRVPQEGNAIRRAAGSIARNAAFVGSSAIGAYSRVQRDLVEQSRTPAAQRVGLTSPGVNERALGRDLRGATANLLGRGTDAQAGMGFRAAMANYQAAANGAAGSTANLRRAVVGVVSPFTAAARAAVSLTGALTRSAASAALSGAGAAASGIGRGLGGLAGMVGLNSPVGLAVAATGAVAYGAYRGNKNQSEYREELGNTSISETMDSFRDSIGRATEGTVTFADQAKNIAKSLSQQASTFAQARTVTTDDSAYAESTRDSVVRDFGKGATAEQIASQLSLQSVTQMTPQELQAVKVDLKRQFNTDKTTEILEQVDVTGSASGTKLSGRADAGLTATAITGINAQNDGYDGGFKGATGNVLQRVLAGPERFSNFGLSDKFRVGGQFNKPTLSEASQTGINDLFGGISQRQIKQTGQYGDLYSRQEQLGGVDEALRSAVGQNVGDDVLAGMIASAGSQLGADTKGLLPQDVRKQMEAGGGISELLIDRDSDFKKRYQDYEKQARDSGATFDPMGNDVGDTGVKALTQESPIMKALAGTGAFGAAFSNAEGLKGSFLNRSVADAVETPGDFQRLSKSVEAMVDATDGSVESMIKLQKESTLAATKLSDVTGTPSQIASAVSARAQQKIGAQSPFQTTSESLSQQRTVAFNDLTAANQGTDEASAKLRQSALERIDDNNAAMADMFKQRIMMYRSASIGETRAQEDQNRSVSFANIDFAKQMARSSADFALQRGRQERSFQRQESRGQVDFDRSRARTIEDQNRNVVRSEQDFYKARSRSQRDFTIQMSRQSLDAARAMYDPYTRIATQAVWDSDQLLMNMREQNTAMAQQVRNLAAARKAGVSNSTITGLGLNKTENAQQLAAMINDITRDPGVVTALNNAGKQTVSLGQQLYGDDANESVKRANEDFKRGLRDQEIDFKLSLTRQASDFALSLARNRKDYLLSLSRNKSDYDRTMAEQAADHDRSMRRAEADQAVSLARMNQAFIVSLGRARADLKLATTELSGSLSELADLAGDAMRGQVKDWSRLTKDGVVDTIAEVQKLIKAGAVTLPALFAASKDLFGGLGGKIKGLFGFGGGGEAEEKDSGSGSGTMTAPVKAPITSGFGPRGSPGGIGSTNHKGIDYGVPIGTSVGAAMAGTVTQAGRAGGYGNAVYLDHGDGKQTRYAHLSSPSVGVGDTVKGGQEIGRSGNTGNSTGPHLHFETRQDGVAYDPRSTLGSWKGTGGAATKPLDVNLQQFAVLMEMLKQSGLKPSDAAAAATDSVGDMGTGRMSSNANVELGRKIAAQHGFTGGQFDALNRLWTGESGWNNTAQNPTSTAYGIAQFLNSTWAGVGMTKSSDPSVQIEAGLRYIEGRYKTPAGALAFWNSNSPHWYGDGGIMMGQTDMGGGNRGGERGMEAVIPLNNQGVSVMATAMSRALSDSDVKQMTTSASRTHVTYHGETYNQDHSVNFSGPVHVQSNDPGKMARDLERKARQKALTSTRS